MVQSQSRVSSSSRTYTAKVKGNADRAGVNRSVTRFIGTLSLPFEEKVAMFALGASGRYCRVPPRFDPA
jgi:hypothetical protein